MRILDQDIAELTRIYETSAIEYYRSLPLEHFMEGMAVGTQRKITLSAFEQIAVHRPDVQCFNELLVQYPRGGNLLDIAKVVPDNLVIVHPEPIAGANSFNTPLQVARIFLAVEYVSTNSTDKDYVENRRRYEQDLEIPYYLMYLADNARLDLLHLDQGHYRPIATNAAGRLSIPELDLEIGLIDGWVRYWFRGELLPLTGELAQEVMDLRGELEDTKGQLEDTKGQLENTRSKLSEAEAEIARLKAELALRLGNSAAS